MIRDLHIEWDLFFSQDGTVDDPTLLEFLINTTLVPNASVKYIHGSKIIIDDIILYSTNVYMLLRYFSCVCKVFIKY